MTENQQRKKALHCPLYRQNQYGRLYYIIWKLSRIRHGTSHFRSYSLTMDDRRLCAIERLSNACIRANCANSRVTSQPGLELAPVLLSKKIQRASRYYYWKRIKD